MNAMDHLGNTAEAVGRVMTVITGKPVRQNPEATHSFAIGHRVVVLDSCTGYMNLPGYYGHVTRVTHQVHHLVWVQLEGRIDGGPLEGYATDLDWPFFPHEIDHID